MHLCKGVFQPTVSSTLGIDFYNKNIEVDQMKISIQLWDTAGQERLVSQNMFSKFEDRFL